MNDKMKAAITAGALLGIVIIVVGAVGTLARGVGCCNCLLPIGGGILAVYLYSKKSPPMIQPGDGAVLGAIAGAVAGVIYLIVGVPIVYFMSAAALAMQFEQLRQSGINLPAGLSVLMIAIIGGIVGVFIYTGLAAIGGLIGTTFIKGEQSGGPVAPAPPPPPVFGGPQPPMPPPTQPPPPPGSDFGGGNFGAGS